VVMDRLEAAGGGEGGVDWAARSAAQASVMREEPCTCRQHPERPICAQTASALSQS
jgi:hypothetical protein